MDWTLMGAFAPIATPPTRISRVILRILPGYIDLAFLQPETQPLTPPPSFAGNGLTKFSPKLIIIRLSIFKALSIGKHLCELTTRLIECAAEERIGHRARQGAHEHVIRPRIFVSKGFSGQDQCSTVYFTIRHVGFVQGK
jgi:hypothetical protein